MIGSGKKFIEKNLFKKIGYAIFGEIHVPGRIRIKHALKGIEALGLPANKEIRVLDVGCAKGDLDFVLAQRYPAWHITGVELDKVKYADACIIKESFNQENVTFYNDDLLKTSGAEEYDIIICSDVLEQIEDDEQAVKRFSELLKKDGHLILTTPSIPQRKHLGLVKWREKKNGIDMSYFGHVRKGYSSEEILSKLKRSSFASVEHKYTYGLFGTLAFDIFFVIGDSSPNPILFALSFPLLLSLAFLDTHVNNTSGSGLLVMASKMANAGA
jgi:2-polyprenyl-3-methyl-5-hydroxy-6-metoxy-1,4-benzoquinol methylase